MRVVPQELTQRFISNYELPDGENQIVLKSTNPDVQGVHLRISRKRKTWYLRKQVNGHPRVNWTLGTWPALSCEDAHNAAIGMCEELDQGKAPVEREEKSRVEIDTVQDALDLYLAVKKHVLSPRYVSDCQSDIKMLGWGHRKIRGITESMVDDKVDEYVAAGKIPSGNAAMETFQRLVIYLMKKGILNKNPVAHLTTDELWPSHAVNRPIFKEPEHWRDAMLIASEWTTPEIGDFWLFAGFCGLRPWSEVATLKWENVDMTGGTFTVLCEHLKVKDPVKRQKKGRVVDLVLPITDPLMEILRRREAHSRPCYTDRQRQFVFPAKLGSSTSGHLTMSSADGLVKAIRSHLGYPEKDEIVPYSQRRFYIQEMREARIEPEARFYLTDQNPGALRGIQAIYDPITFKDIKTEAERLASHLSETLVKTG